MVTISIEIEYGRHTLKRTAILTDDLSGLIDCKENEATEITDFYFFEDDWFLTFNGFNRFSSIEIALRKNNKVRTAEVIGGSIQEDESSTLICKMEDIKYNVEHIEGDGTEKVVPTIPALGIANRTAQDGCRFKVWI